MGSITREPWGTWRARWRTPQGESRSRSFKKKVQAERYLAAVEHSKHIGGYIDPSADDN